MKKFGFASLFLALTFAQLGCGDTAPAPPEPTLAPMTSPSGMTPENTAAPAADGATTPAPAAEGDAKPAPAPEGDAKPAPEGETPAP